jgi:hypothetical protein
MYSTSHSAFPVASGSSSLVLGVATAEELSDNAVLEAILTLASTVEIVGVAESALLLTAGGLEEAPL